MNMKKLIAAVVLGLFLVPAFVSAYTYSPDDYDGVTETLVEGHTVFAVIQADICVNDDAYQNATPCPNAVRSDFDVSYDIRANVTLQRMGTAVAVLVRDRVKEVVVNPNPPVCGSNKDLVATIFYENPGVLWFNDQFLVGDDLDLVEVDIDANVDICRKTVNQNVEFDPIPYTYPCGGWIWATQAGNPDPRTGFHWVYQESYYITDPNDHAWIIDKFRPGIGGTADLLAQDVLSTPPGTIPSADDPVPTGGTVPAQDQAASNPVVGLPGGASTGDSDGPGYDGDDAADQDVRVAAFGSNSADMQYFLGGFNLWTVPVYYGTAGVADPLGPTGRTPANDCDPYDDVAPRSPAYPLPQVRYNAVLFFFFEDLRASGIKMHGAGGADAADISFCDDNAVDPPNNEWDCATAGKNDQQEGNSHPYNGASTANDADGGGPIHLHPTAMVDLYYHNTVPTVPPRDYAVYDGVGAGYGSGAPYHTHGAEPFDDRVRISACGDVDIRQESRTETFNGGSYTTTSSSYSYTGADTYSGAGGSPNGPYGSTSPTSYSAAGDPGANCVGGPYGGGSTGSPGETY